MLRNKEPRPDANGSLFAYQEALGQAATIKNCSSTNNCSDTSWSNCSSFCLKMWIGLKIKFKIEHLFRKCGLGWNLNSKSNLSHVEIVVHSWWSILINWDRVLGRGFLWFCMGPWACLAPCDFGRRGLLLWLSGPVGLGFVAIVRVFLLLLNDRFVLSVVMAP